MPKRLVTSLPVQELTVNNTNWYKGRDNADVTQVVIHSIVGTIGGANNVFNTYYEDKNKRRSTHYGIGLDGKIYHWVDENNTAFANSNWQVNLGAISIEHEDNGNAYDAKRTDAQYEASARLVHDICRYYGLKIDRNTIIKHKEVPSARTACPAGLDIDRIVKAAATIDTPIEKPTMIVTVEQNTINVTKASNFDAVGNYLGLSEDQKRGGNMGNWVVDYIKRIQAEREAALKQTGTTQPNSGGAPIAPSNMSTPQIPAQQSVSIWQKDILEVLDTLRSKLLRGGQN